MSHPLWYTTSMKINKDTETPEVQESTKNIEGENYWKPTSREVYDYDSMWGVSGYYNDNNGNDIRDRD